MRLTLAFLLVTSYVFAQTANEVTIAIVNRSATQVGQEMIDALQKQIQRDVFPVWGRTARLSLAATAADPDPASTYYCIIEDTTDAPGEVGYHDVDASGRPYCKVFASTISDWYTPLSGSPVSVILSHELLEMLVNPHAADVILVMTGGSKTQGSLYSKEICDEVQNNTYQIDGVAVSDFITPPYFVPGSQGPFDYLGVLNGPLTVAPYGHLSMVTVIIGGRWS